MKATEVAAKIAAMKGGTIHQFSIAKAIKLKNKEMAEKQSSFSGMVKTSYANGKDVKAAIEAGERDAPELPAWAEPVEIDGVRFIRHKGNGKLYLPIKPNGNGKRSSKVLLNGKELSTDERETLLYAKDKSKGETPAWVTIATDNIQAIK